MLLEGAILYVGMFVEMYDEMCPPPDHAALLVPEFSLVL
jgi:hypothetical protein